MTGANRNKVGAPFPYAESLFVALAAVKSVTGLPYRHLQGMLIEALGDGDSPCYTTMHRRFQALDVKRHDGVFAVTGGGTVPFILHIVNTSLWLDSWIRDLAHEYYRTALVVLYYEYERMICDKLWQ